MKSYGTRRVFPNPFDLLRDGWTAYQVVKEIVRNKREIAKFGETVKDYLLVGLILAGLLKTKLQRRPYSFWNLILLLLIAHSHKMLRRGFKSTYAPSKSHSALP